MLPTLFTIPTPWGDGIAIKGYGLMLMIGFLTGIYTSMRRAQKVRCDPDIVLNAGFLSLICGVFGARLFYVVHYWDTHFKGRGLLAAFDVTAGGLEFYGGFIAAVAAIFFYLRVKGYSARLFLDAMAPGVMWGLAFGRLGCTLNGCCFGGTCPAHFPWPLAVTFPYGSPAHQHHFYSNRASLPRELMYIDPFGLIVRPINRDHIAMKPEQIYGPQKKYKQAGEILQARFDKIMPPESAENVRAAWRRFAAERRLLPRGPILQNTQEARQAWARFQAVHQELTEACAMVLEGQKLYELVKDEHSAWEAWQDHRTELRDLLGDGRNIRPGPAGIQKLQELTKQFRSHTVYFAQPIGFINGMILSGVLSLIYYRRRMHGVVFGWMFVLYPITRFILELIRADNPIDSGGMTISQAISLGVSPVALIYLLILYKFFPPQSPRARIWTPPSQDPPPPSTGSPETSAPREAAPSPSAKTTDTSNDAPRSQAKKTKRKVRKPVVETVLVAPGTSGAASQDWLATEAACAKCGAALRPPQGLIYQQRASKRNSQPRSPGVPDIDSPDPSTTMELICEACFDRRPPQDKTRARRLAKKWWKTGKV